MSQNNPSGSSVAELPPDYQDIPEPERKKAQAFFDKGLAVGGAGQFEFAIEMYLQGLTIDPENTEAHQSLRDISIKRKASGGKDLGFMEKMKMKIGRASGRERVRRRVWR